MIAEDRTARQIFDTKLAAQHMRGQWSIDEQHNSVAADGPKPMGIPFIWKWPTIRQALSEACGALSNSLTQRRSLLLVNPGLSNFGTTHTFGVGVQLVMPGESAWAHRHTMAAIRFGIEGDDSVTTVVNGERLPMHRNDLVMTPSLTWHDHHNSGTHDAIWLDVIDAPMVGGLGQRWYEAFGDSLQPERKTRSEYISERSKVLRPAWEHRQTVNIPLRYAWSDVNALLEQYADSEGSPYDGIRLEYVNPMTGGPSLATMGCYVQLLPQGYEAKDHRHTSSTAYYVIKGTGVTVVDGVELVWSDRDVFVVPNWMRHRHINTTPGSGAVLFSVTDEPLLRSMGLYREDPDPQSFMKPTPTVPANIARTR